MKVSHRLLIAATVSVVIIGASQPTSAQAPGFHIAPRGYLAGGVAAVSNPDSFKDRYTNKFSLLAGLGLALSPTLEVIAKLHFYNFDLKDTFKARFVDPNISFTTIGADLKWKLLPGPSPAKPYLLLGAGSMTLNLDTPPNVPNSGESDIYFNFGGGLDISLGPSFAFFVEGKFVILNTDVDATGIAPVLVGVRLF